ncbi:hypothetical protein [Eubacterium sp. 1001713B170207_170306_E7]|uniref:hypothetical protein n=1 Tax=Eubacterium sp. 1001713B170207_170306_E7 TaxID=2787097 RepID=UPI00189BCECC|nr:hypothetical protein [Eubacterium sp. 1001713B170207_170306_E7]
MNETKRDWTDRLAAGNPLGCIKCALEMGQEVPLTFYRAFCEDCCKNQRPMEMNDGLRAFQAMDLCEQEQNLESLKKRIDGLLKQYEKSLCIYGERVREGMNLIGLSDALGDAIRQGDIKLWLNGRNGGVR